ncbi:MAG: hypothetical protein Q9181_007347, partial [Wetmoreana brouardii]
MSKPTALITGCSQGGIGDALAHRLVTCGFHVLAAVRNRAKAAHFSEMESIEIVTLDVTSSDSISSLVADHKDRLPDGKLDLLVNNAGFGATGPLIEADMATTKRLFDVNVLGLLAVTQAFAPMLIAAKGKVVNISSVGGMLAMPWSGLYHASKAAVTILSETLRLELAPLGVTVITGMLGNIESNFHANDSWQGLPKSSRYKTVESEIAKTAEGKIGPKKEKLDDFARRFVGDVVKGASGQGLVQMEYYVSDLLQALPGKVFPPGAKEYEKSLYSYFSAQKSTLKPACIVCPHTSADVATIVSHLVQANQLQGIGSCKFAIRSGGHACFAGSANTSNGITIDLRGMNSIKVSEDHSQVCIGTGASWGEVYRTLDPMGLAVPGGRQSQVGVGGLTLGGGLSHFSGHAGLVCDAVTEYEVVLASGSTIRATENDPDYGDLFRALRGGSNNFGIVTRFTFRTFPQGRLWGGTLIYPIETKDQQLQAFYEYSTSPSCDPNVSLIHSFGMSAERGSGFVNSIVHTKPESEPTVIKPFTSLKPTYLNTLRELSLTELTVEQDSYNRNGL